MLLVEAGAVIDVDEVEARRFLADLHLAGSGIADLDFFPFENVGSCPSDGFGSRASWSAFNASRSKRKAPLGGWQRGSPFAWPT